MPSSPNSAASAADSQAVAAHSPSARIRSPVFYGLFYACRTSTSLVVLSYLCAIAIAALPALNVFAIQYVSAALEQQD